MTLDEIAEEVESAHQILLTLKEHETDGRPTFIMELHERETILQIIDVFKRNAEYDHFEIDRLLELNK